MARPSQCKIGNQLSIVDINFMFVSQALDVQDQNDAENAGDEVDDQDDIGPNPDDEFAFAKKEEKSDAQLLGSATKEQIEKSQNAMIDDDKKEDENLEAVPEDEPAQDQKPADPNEQKIEMVDAHIDSKNEENEQQQQESENNPTKSSKSFEKKSKPSQDTKSDATLTRMPGVDDVHPVYDPLASQSQTQALDAEEIERMRQDLETTLAMRKSEASQIDEAKASEVWQQFQALTAGLSQDLCEQLRLILTESQASKLQGDFRTGKRLNMRKIIPYIAIQFRKDKIWLRRTKPSKREYQILLAIDDSRSMALYHSKQLAMEALCVISGALSRLEAGSLGVLSFGEQTKMVHRFDEPLSDQAGAFMIQQFTFEQEKTQFAKLMETVTKLMADAKSKSSRTASDLVVSQLVFVISDNDNLYQEGQQLVEKWVRATIDSNVFLVFVIVDSPQKPHSILDQKKIEFVGGQLRTDDYIDRFSDKNYVILRFEHNVNRSITQPFTGTSTHSPRSLAMRCVSGSRSWRRPKEQSDTFHCFSQPE